MTSKMDTASRVILPERSTKASSSMETSQARPTMTSRNFDILYSILYSMKAI